MEFLKKSMNRSGVLRFTPYAWAKLVFMRDAGDTEVGGYGINETDDPLLINDFRLVKQDCSGVSVDLDQEDSLAFAEEMTDRGFSPWQYGTWIHTHPGDSPSPSQADEENFRDNFSIADCSIFFILAKCGQSYTRMRYNVSPGIDVDIKSMIDFRTPFRASDQESWKKEYSEKVNVKTYIYTNNMFKKETDLLERISFKNDKSLFEKREELNFQDCSILSTLDDNEKDESAYVFEEGDSIFFYVDEEEDYYEFNKKLRRFYDQSGKRIKNPELEWEQIILDFVKNQENDPFTNDAEDVSEQLEEQMEKEYANIIDGQSH
jgi:hypothetical protein